ncbi:MAG: class I SAM-dependent methyltransferase [Planctomycetales bacterium]|nr:class I SAM-dependent methyltransferase [Planctomycetales bacterium]
MRPKIFERATKRLLQPSRDASALQKLAGFGLGYVPWSAAAMRPESVVMLANEILINRRCSVLELGSGVSTLFGAAAIAQLGDGHIDSVDQDEDWIKIVRQMLCDRNLESFVTFHHAPLVNRQDIRWPSGMTAVGDYFDTSKIEQAIQEGSKSLIIVDAPTAYQVGREYARFPAFQVFRKYFADEFTIILDDILRHGERRAVEHWGKELQQRPTIDLIREMGILTTGHRWVV